MRQDSGGSNQEGQMSEKKGPFDAAKDIKDEVESLPSYPSQKKCLIKLAKRIADYEGKK